MEMLLFEDAAVANLLPLAWIRPVYSLRTASWPLIDMVHRLAAMQGGGPVLGHVRPFLRDLQRVDYGLDSTQLSNQGHRLLLNARLIPCRRLWEELHDLLMQPRPVIASRSGELVYACLSSSVTLPTPLALSSLRIAAEGQVPIDTFEYRETACRLLQWPHDLVAANQEFLGENLELRLRSQAYQEIRDGVFVGPRVRMVEPIVTDTRSGPIVIESDVEINAFSQLTGPLHIDSHAWIQSHSLLVGPLSVGIHAKLGGEIEAAIVDSYSNKKHYGFLGHSYVGQWVNLGAGTVTGNLKHTYGEIRMRYADAQVATGQQFLGCLLGDYSRSAIHTGIFTGKVIGIGSWLLGMVTEDVGCFVNHGNAGGGGPELPWEMVCRMQEAMHARRKRPTLACHREVLRMVFQWTRERRDPCELFGETCHKTRPNALGCVSAAVAPFLNPACPTDPSQLG